MVTEADDRQIHEAREDGAPVHNRLPVRLTKRERAIELRAQEGVIEKWRRDGFKAGEAFAVIRAQRLYRGMIIEGHPIKTFPDYCKRRWGIDASRARQLIGFAKAAVTLHTATGIEPTNENQVRPLLRLVRDDPDKAADLWREANQVADSTAETPERATTTERLVRSLLRGALAEEAAPEPVAAPTETDGTFASKIDHAIEQMHALINFFQLNHYEEGFTVEARNALPKVVRTTIAALQVLVM